MCIRDSSQFNSDWAGKLLIMVDEVLLNRREDSERLKNPSPHFPTRWKRKAKTVTKSVSSPSSCCVPTMNICPSS